MKFCAKNINPWNVSGYIHRSLYHTMPAPSQKPDIHDDFSANFFAFLGAPMAGNASSIAVFVHWLATAFNWFLRLLLLLLGLGVLLGIGALIFGSLPFHKRRRGGELKTFAEGDVPPDVNSVELEFLTGDYDPEDISTSDSDQ